MFENRSLYSPNRMVWELFEALRRLSVRVAAEHAEQDEVAVRQDSAICIILAVQCVEVFFNIYFRVLISESAFAHAKERISADLLRTQFGLDRKIKEWPELAFGKKINLDKGAGQRFIKLKNLRHALMHFSSSHETISIPGVTMHGMADASAYDSLSVESAIEALHVAEAFLCEVFILRGISINNLPQNLGFWTGKPLMS